MVARTPPPGRRSRAAAAEQKGRSGALAVSLGQNSEMPMNVDAEPALMPQYWAVFGTGESTGSPEGWNGGPAMPTQWVPEAWLEPTRELGSDRVGTALAWWRRVFYFGIVYMCVYFAYHWSTWKENRSRRDVKREQLLSRIEDNEPPEKSLQRFRLGVRGRPRQMSKVDFKEKVKEGRSRRSSLIANTF